MISVLVTIESISKPSYTRAVVPVIIMAETMLMHIVPNMAAVVAEALESLKEIFFIMYSFLEKILNVHY